MYLATGVDAVLADDKRHLGGVVGTHGDGQVDKGAWVEPFTLLHLVAFVGAVEHGTGHRLVDTEIEVAQQSLLLEGGDGNAGGVRQVGHGGCLFAVGGDGDVHFAPWFDLGAGFGVLHQDGAARVTGLIDGVDDNVAQPVGVVVACLVDVQSHHVGHLAHVAVSAIETKKKEYQYDDDHRDGQHQQQVFQYGMLFKKVFFCHYYDVVYVSLLTSKDIFYCVRDKYQLILPIPTSRSPRSLGWRR